MEEESVQRQFVRLLTVLVLVGDSTDSVSMHRLFVALVEANYSSPSVSSVSKKACQSMLADFLTFGRSRNKVNDAVGSRRDVRALVVLCVSHPLHDKGCLD